MIEKKSVWKDERGQFTYVLLFVIIFVILLILFAIVIPILEALSIGMWGTTDTVISPIIQNQIDTISDTNVKAAIQAAYDKQGDMQATTEELFMTLVTYSGIITIVVIFFVWLLIGRRNVEAGGLA